MPSSFPKNYGVSIHFQTQDLEMSRQSTAEQREKWRLATQRYRDKKLALDPEGWREEQRLRVASDRARNGPLTEEQRLDRNEASRLGMQDLRARRDRQAKAATRANVSTLMNN